MRVPFSIVSTIRAVVGTVVAFAASGAAAQPSQPLWEAGIGVGALSLPDYRGSDQRHAYLLPFPYIEYRGDRLRIDREGLHTSVFDSERLDLDLSFTGNFALRSRDNVAREGMPELYPVVEGGPELVWRIAGASRGGWGRLDLRVATRAALAVGDGKVSAKGWVASPYLRLTLPNAAGTGYEVNATLGLLYADRRHHEYLYSVAPEFATATRPAYQARGGYAGAIAQIGAGRRYGRLWVGGYLRTDTLRGAVFEDSPLVRTRGYTAGGIAVAWILGASSRPAGAE